MGNQEFKKEGCSYFTTVSYSDNSTYRNVIYKPENFVKFFIFLKKFPIGGCSEV